MSYTGYVYVMTDCRNLTKIGFSVNTEARRRQLASEELRTICLYSAAGCSRNSMKYIESMAHGFLEEFWVEGEWYDIDPELAKEVVECVLVQMQANHELAQARMNAEAITATVTRYEPVAA